MAQEGNVPVGEVDSRQAGVEIAAELDEIFLGVVVCEALLAHQQVVGRVVAGIEAVVEMDGVLGNFADAGEKFGFREFFFL